MTNGRFDALFGGPPRKPESRLTPRHMDLAASVQAVLDEAMLRLARALAQESGIAQSVSCRRCRAQLRRQRQGPARRRISQIWIQPAAGDAGGALGAALAGYHLHKGQPRRINNRPDAMQGAYLGPSFTPAQIRAALDKQWCRLSRAR